MHTIRELPYKHPFACVRSFLLVQQLRTPTIDDRPQAKHKGPLRRSGDLPGFASEFEKPVSGLLKGCWLAWISHTLWACSLQGSMEGLNPPEVNLQPLKLGPPGKPSSSHQGSVSEARPSGCRASIQVGGLYWNRRTKVQLVQEGADFSGHCMPSPTTVLNCALFVPSWAMPASEHEFEEIDPAVPSGTRDPTIRSMLHPG